MQKINEIRKKAITHLLCSPFLKKNNYYMLNNASLDVDLILSHVLKTTRSHLIASLDEKIDNKIIYKLDSLFKLRFKGLSIAYIIEEKEFYGLKFFVNKDVLIPKADTELLVEKGIQAINAMSCNLENRNDKLNILDVFAGSGCVAISVANSTFPLYNNYTLIDISEKALNVAKINAKKLISTTTNFSFIVHDALKSFPITNGEKYDLILANPPYVPHKHVLSLLSDGRAEPSIALDGGEDGLYFYKILAKHSFASLNKYGRLISEVGDGQADIVINIFKNANFNSCVFYKDLSGEKRVVEAIK